MSEKQSRTPVRFCPGCGQSAVAGANFCTACGAALRGGGPSVGGNPLPAQFPALAVFAGFLTVGLVLWFLILSGGEDRSRLPLAQKPQPEAPQGAPGAQGSLPPDHPPVGLPEDVKKFIAELEKKAAESPTDLEAWKQLAQVHYRAGQVDRAFLTKAEASYRRVLEIDPKSTDALRGLGNVHFDRDEFARAIEAYGGYLAIVPDDLNVRTDLGTMYLSAGRDDDALREYRQVLDKDPKFYQAQFNVGIALAKKGDREGSFAAFEKAKAIAPDEETRGQIQAMIDRGSGVAPSGGGEAATPAGGFRARVEQALRTHPIAGPKVVAFEWRGPGDGRVLLENFPMENMPEPIRLKFLDRLRKELTAEPQDEGSKGPARLELVDRASGKVMATVTAGGSS